MCKRRGDDFGPLQKGLAIFKSGQVSKLWIEALNGKVNDALEKAIASVHWMILPGIEAKKFVFIIESD